MLKWCKRIIAVLLLPVCIGAGSALWFVLRTSATAETIWVPLVAGAGCWLAIYLLLPKPMWIYVAGHEFTHAIWTWLMGGRVKKFKITSAGGHVVVTKSNFLIALAPYFFPLYALMVIAIFAGGRALWHWHAYAVWFHFFLGAAYAFHLTLTWHILKTTQSDITQHGYLFSAVVIFLGNIGLLLLAIPPLTGTVTVTQVFHWWSNSSWEVVQTVLRMLSLRWRLA